MKVLFIVPGSGDSFYCGNCFRDNLQANALRKAGHDVIVMPLYLPLRFPSFQADTPLFFPATTFYTAQKFFGNRKMPNWLKRVTGSDVMLNVATSLSGSTNAEGLEEMTLAMITGNDTAFQEMVTQLIDWVKNQDTPDVIHLSSTLLIGIAKEIKQQINLPIVCSMQDEEVWLDCMDKVYAEVAWRGILENACYIDCFVASSNYYKKMLQQRLPQLTEVEVVYPGVNVEKYACQEYPAKPTIGFFYRMNEADGLDILVDAFIQLKEKNTIPHLSLRIGGGYTAKDKAFIKDICKRLAPYKEDVVIEDTYNLEEHAQFYKQISVICVPLRFEEGVGLYLCEAFAAGRPAVEPLSGSFPEIVGNAGMLYYPNESSVLSATLEKILGNKEELSYYRKAAVQLANERYSDVVLAESLMKLYKQIELNNI